MVTRPADADPTELGEANTETSLKSDTTELDAHQSHQSNLLLQHVVGESPQLVHAALEMLDGMYQGNAEDARYLRGDRGAAMRDISTSKAQGSEYAATYGEILPASLVQLLAELQAVPGQRFYDLGSGTGKTVFLAWLLGFKAIGVELARERWKASSKILAAALHGQITTYSGGDSSWGIQFVQADIARLDFSDADIVFANSVYYPKTLMDAIAKGACRMRPGTHIVTVGGLDSDWLRRVGVIKLPTSWNPKGTNFIIQVVHSTASRPQTPVWNHCSQSVRRPSMTLSSSKQFNTIQKPRWFMQGPPPIALLRGSLSAGALARLP